MKLFRMKQQEAIELGTQNQARKGTKKGRKRGTQKLEMGERGKKAFAMYVAIVVYMTCFTIHAYATNDPLTVVNNLSNFIFGLVRAIGMIMLGFGIVQIGLSLKSHDPSQRANGFLTLAGGVVITFAREILTLIAGA